MSAANRTAWALALELARRHFDGIPVRPGSDPAANAAYYQAMDNVRRDLRHAGYKAYISQSYAVRGLSALRKEREAQEAPSPTPPQK